MAQLRGVARDPGGLRRLVIARVRWKRNSEPLEGGKESPQRLAHRGEEPRKVTEPAPNETVKQKRRPDDGARGEEAEKRNGKGAGDAVRYPPPPKACLLYTSDAADEEDSV